MRSKLNIHQLIFDRNRDLLERTKRLTVATDYIKADDVLLITIGKPRSSIALSLEDGLIIHYNPYNYKILGFTVVNFKNWLKVHSKVRSTSVKLTKPTEVVESVDPIALSSLSNLSPAFAF